MDLKWLDDFRALARTRHFSRAADEQNVSQPTFSRRIKLLEESVGVMLIDRNTLPLSLTPAGQLFLEAAERISRDLRETKEACLDLERVEAEKLRFATNQTLYLSFFQGWKQRLSESAGEDLGLDINLHSTGWFGEDFVRALQQDDCDLVLCYWHPRIEFLEPLESGEFEHLTLAQERLIPVSAGDESGQPKYPLPGSEREPLPYIGYNTTTFLSPVVADHLRKVEPQPHLLQVNLSSQATSVMAMISQGYGVGWLPQRLLQQGGLKGLVNAGDARWEIELELRLYRQRNKISPRLDALWQRIIND